MSHSQRLLDHDQLGEIQLQQLGGLQYAKTLKRHNPAIPLIPFVDDFHEAIRLAKEEEAQDERELFAIRQTRGYKTTYIAFFYGIQLARLLEMAYGVFVWKLLNKFCFGGWNEEIGANLPGLFSWDSSGILLYIINIFITAPTVVGDFGANFNSAKGDESAKRATDLVFYHAKWLGKFALLSAALLTINYLTGASGQLDGNDVIVNDWIGNYVSNKTHLHTINLWLTPFIYYATIIYYFAVHAAPLTNMIKRWKKAKEAKDYNLYDHTSASSRVKSFLRLLDFSKDMFVYTLIRTVGFAFLAADGFGLVNTRLGWLGMSSMPESLMYAWIVFAIPATVFQAFVTTMLDKKDSVYDKNHDAYNDFIRHNVLNTTWSKTNLFLSTITGAGFPYIAAFLANFRGGAAMGTAYTVMAGLGLGVAFLDYYGRLDKDRLEAFQSYEALAVTFAKLPEAIKANEPNNDLVNLKRRLQTDSKEQAEETKEAIKNMKEIAVQWRKLKSLVNVQVVLHNPADPYYALYTKLNAIEENVRANTSPPTPKQRFYANSNWLLSSSTNLQRQVSLLFFVITVAKIAGIGPDIVENPTEGFYAGALLGLVFALPNAVVTQKFYSARIAENMAKGNDSQATEVNNDGLCTRACKMGVTALTAPFRYVNFWSNRPWKPVESNVKDVTAAGRPLNVV